MRASALGAIAAIGLATTALAADPPVVTKAPAFAPPPGPQFFLWIEGGYSAFDLSRIHAFDVGTGIPPGPTFFDLESGWYGRGETGVVLAQRFGLIDAVSLAVWYRRGSSDIARTGVSGELSYTSPSADFDPSVGGNVRGTAEQEFSLLDVQVRLKHAPVAWPGVSVNLEPFVGRMNHDASARIRNPDPKRSANIEGDIFGMQVAIEGRYRATEILTLRGRGAVGGYHMNVDGDFGFRCSFCLPGGANDSFSRNLNGLRASAEIGADIALAPNVLLGVSAGVDYWSEMPFARLTVSDTMAISQPPIGIDSDSFTDFFVGARLTFVSGGR
jgi:hypothetical protein